MAALLLFYANANWTASKAFGDPALRRGPLLSGIESSTDLYQISGFAFGDGVVEMPARTISASSSYEPRYGYSGSVEV